MVGHNFSVNVWVGINRDIFCCSFFQKKSIFLKKINFFKKMWFSIVVVHRSKKSHFWNLSFFCHLYKKWPFLGEKKWGFFIKPGSWSSLLAFWSEKIITMPFIIAISLGASLFFTKKKLCKKTREIVQVPKIFLS